MLGYPELEPAYLKLRAELVAEYERESENDEFFSSNRNIEAELERDLGIVIPKEVRWYLRSLRSR